MSNSKGKVSGRIPADVDSQFEEYRDEHDLNQTDALVRLLRTGLDEEMDDGTAEKQHAAFATDLFFTLGVALLALGFAALLWSSRAHLPFALSAGGIVATGIAHGIRTGVIGDGDE